MRHFFSIRKMAFIEEHSASVGRVLDLGLSKQTSELAKLELEDLNLILREREGFWF